MRLLTRVRVRLLLELRALASIEVERGVYGADMMGKIRVHTTRIDDGFDTNSLLNGVVKVN